VYLQWVNSHNNKLERGKMKNKVIISFSNLIGVDVGTYDNNTYCFSYFDENAIDGVWEYLRENKDPILEIPEIIERPYMIAEALDAYGMKVYRKFDKEIVRVATKHLLPVIEPIFKKYGVKVGKFSYSRPQFYNYRTDELDLELIIEKSYLEDLKPEITQYVNEVRQGSYDGYMSFEPDEVDKVTETDYAYFWAILKRGNMFDEIKEIFEEDIYAELSDWLSYELYESYLDGLEKGVKADFYDTEKKEYTKKIKLKLTKRKE